MPDVAVQIAPNLFWEGVIKITWTNLLLLRLEKDLKFSRILCKKEEKLVAVQLNTNSKVAKESRHLISASGGNWRFMSLFHHEISKKGVTFLGEGEDWLNK